MSKSCNHERVIVSTPLSPNLPFSPAVAFGPFVFCSGIVYWEHLSADNTGNGESSTGAGKSWHRF
jgi:hypothetical protein